MLKKFDWQFYTQYYEDLKHFNEPGARAHWIRHGQGEGRKGYMYDLDEYSTFNHTFYCDIYPDLKKLNFDKPTAFKHWIEYGKKEGRTYNEIKYWSKVNLQQHTSNYSIALLIPGTSNNRNWASIKESDLYKILLKSFINFLDKELKFKIFFGIDHGDKIYDNKDNQSLIKFCVSQFNMEIDFIYMDIEKGYLSKMWNKLFKYSL